MSYFAGGSQLSTGPYVNGRAPDFLDPPNRFGEYPAYTWSHNSGPVFDSRTGRELAQRQERDQVLAAYFGKKTKEEVQDPYDAYDIENYQLPDGFTGKRPFLKFIILRGITAKEQYPYREMLPFTREETTQEIFWDIWKFNNHTLGRTPEESVSRMLTMNVSQGREAMIRYGIALQLEHGFYMTDKGRLNYRKNLEQIMNAAATTLAYGAMFACLTAFYLDPNDIYRKKQTRGLQQIGEVFQDEIDTWAIIQKTEDGWGIIYDKCREKLKQRNGFAGDYTVVPAGTRKYVAGRPENKYFLYTGIPGGARPDVMQAEGILRESIGFRMQEHAPVDDPCIRQRTIGGFWWLPVRIPKEGKFSYADVNIDVYSEGSDDYATLSYKDDLFPNFGLWDWKSPVKRISNIGRKYFAAINVNTWKDLIDKTKM